MPYTHCSWPQPWEIYLAGEINLWEKERKRGQKREGRESPQLDRPAPKKVRYTATRLARPPEHTYVSFAENERDCVTVLALWIYAYVWLIAHAVLYVQYPSCISGLGCYQMFRMLCDFRQMQHFSAATRDTTRILYILSCAKMQQKLAARLQSRNLASVLLQHSGQLSAFFCHQKWQPIFRPKNDCFPRFWRTEESEDSYDSVWCSYPSNHVLGPPKDNIWVTPPYNAMLLLPASSWLERDCRSQKAISLPADDASKCVDPIGWSGGRGRSGDLAEKAAIT